MSVGSNVASFAAEIDDESYVELKTEFELEDNAGALHTLIDLGSERSHLWGREVHMSKFVFSADGHRWRRKEFGYKRHLR